MDEVDVISLDGTWEFDLDPMEQGLRERWFSGHRAFTKKLRVPGCWQAQGFGGDRIYACADRVTLLTPADLCTGWYRRAVTVPGDWPKREVWLHFKGVHPTATVWLDGREVCRHSGPYLPFKVRVTPWIRPGSSHTLIVRVSEEARLLQGPCKWPAFSGIFREASLESTGTAWFDDVYIQSGIHRGRVLVHLTLGCSMPCDVDVECQVRETSGEMAASARTSLSVQPGREAYAHMPVDLQAPKIWSPDSPFLYECHLVLRCGESVMDARSVRFGLREFRTEGKRILLNEKPLFLRGAALCGPFHPLELSPTGDKEYYRKLIMAAKEYGFNYLRWHTYPCEPELLDVADELGFLVQSEAFWILWATSEERQLTQDLWRGMIRKNRNHPSAFLWSMGNEQESPDPVFNGFRDELYEIAKEMAPGTLVINTDGCQFANRHLGKSDLFLASAGATNNAGGALNPEGAVESHVQFTDRPTVLHECGYPGKWPDPSHRAKYTGGLVPLWLDQAVDVAKKKGVMDLLPVFIKNSRKLYEICYRLVIEGVRKVPDLAGYFQQTFRDSGWDLGGLVDSFLDDDVTAPERYRRWNGEVVLLMTPCLDRYTAAEGEDFPFDLHLSNHGGGNLRGAHLRWELRDGKRIVACGEKRTDASAYALTNFGRFVARIDAVGKPRTLTLEASLASGGARVANEWDIWAFPREGLKEPPVPVMQLAGWDPGIVYERLARVYPFIRVIREPELREASADGVLITLFMTPSCSDYLKRGGRVILLPGFYPLSRPGLPVKASHFRAMPSYMIPFGEGNLGTVVARHPALGDFPNDGYADLQFYDLVDGSRYPVLSATPFWNVVPGVYDLDVWPVKIDPIIRSIPSCQNCSNRAYVFEVRVGTGRLLAVSLRIRETLGTNPETEYLLNQLLRYATSEQFKPVAQVTVEQFEKLLQQVSIELP